MRLIDADALKEKLDAWALNLTGKVKSEMYIRDDAVYIIDSMPTIDAVPVVRCKDCKHFRTFRTSYDGEEIRACVGNGIVDPYYDDFCSKGERKDNE